MTQSNHSKLVAQFARPLLGLALWAMAAALIFVLMPNPIAAGPPVAPNAQNEDSGPCELYPIMIPVSKVSGIYQGSEVEIEVSNSGIIPGNFYWLHWKSDEPAHDGPDEYGIPDNLANPDNIITDYLEPDSAPADTVLNINDWIQGNPGAHGSSSVIDALNDLIGTEMLMPVWYDGDCYPGGACLGAEASGSTMKFKTLTFISMKLMDVSYSSLPKTLTFQFSHFDPYANNENCNDDGGGDELSEVSNIDLALVLDSTGSMLYDTICFGCWERCGDSGLIDPADCDGSDKYKPYPENGRKFPFPYPPSNITQTNWTTSQNRMVDLIVGEDGDDTVWPPTPGTPDPELGKPGYIIFEAEFYSDNSHPWDPAVRTLGQGYWAIQRQTYKHGDRSGNDQGQAFAIDGYGYEVPYSPSDNTLTLNGLVRHHPMTENADGLTQPYGRHYTEEEAENDTSPRLEYDFVPTWGGNTTIHFKAQYYDGNNNTAPDNEFWYAIYRASDVANIYPGPAGSSNVKRMTGGERNDHWEPNPSREWDWISDNTGMSLTPGVKYTLKIWAGSGGYAFDRIIIADSGRNITSPDIRHDPATKGSAQRLAADPCNPIFGLTVVGPECTYSTLPGPTNNANDPLFDAWQPMRGAQEGMRQLISKLNPATDQVGLVDFDGDAGQRAQLECLRAVPGRVAGLNAPADQVSIYPLDPANGYPEYDEYECADPAKSSTGVPIGYASVLMALEDPYPPAGNTDIADGLRRGLHLLGIDTDDDPDQNNDCEWRWNGTQWQIINGGSWVNQPSNGRNENPTSHCGRGSEAVSAIVLLTDGAPTNNNPGDNDDCKNWDDLNPPPYPDFPSAPDANEDMQDRFGCIMHYAEIAGQNNVPVCAIGLGPGADADLMQAIADFSNGQFFYVPMVSQLDTVIDSLLESCLGGLGADLQVSKTRLSTDTVQAGRPITYTLAISNVGPTGPVTATLVDRWSPVGAVSAVSAPGCSVDLAGGVLTCTHQSLAVGASALYTTVFTASDDFSGTLTNTVSVTSSGQADFRVSNNDAGPVLVQFIDYEELYLPVVFKK